MLNILNKFDNALLSLPAHQLYTVLPGPTLIHLKGEKEPAIFISVLLHGNENSGWEVVKNIVQLYKNKTLPRSLSIFIGNVKAARYKKRKLQKQHDFNRVWRKGETAEHQVIEKVMQIMQERGVFASIDIHNNNGLNPHYACVNKLGKKYLALAKEFSNMIIYFIRPDGVQSKAFSKFCPAVTLEIGKPGDEYGIQKTIRFIDTILNQDKLKVDRNIEEKINLYHTVGIIKIPDSVDFSFEGEKAGIKFIKGIESLNFEEVPKQTLIANVTDQHETPLMVRDEEGNDIVDRYFEIRQGGIYTRSMLIPAMLTTDKNIIRQDCFCYLMEHYDISQGEKVSTDEAVWQ